MGHTPTIFLKARDLVDSGEKFSIDGNSYRKDNYGKLEMVWKVIRENGTRVELHISSSPKRDQIVEESNPDMKFKLIGKPFTVNGEQRTYFDLVQVEDDDVPF